MSNETIAVLKAVSVTLSTLIGAIKTNYPIDYGNCFSVQTECGNGYRIVNFNLENFNEVIKRGVALPITIHQLDDRTAIIHDPRIPDEWYDVRWCEVCCTDSLLPIQQKLARDREVKQGVRTVLEHAIRVDYKKRPTLPKV